MSADKTTQAVIEALKQGMAQPGEHRLYKIGKLAGLFPGRTGAHIEAARAVFLEAGWHGDGEIGLLWLPPFVFPLESQEWVGLALWHVKQVEDGTSWLLSPVELPFEGFARWIV